MSSLGFLGTPGHSCPHEGTAWEWNCVAGDFITRRECLKLLGVKESIHLFFWTNFNWKHQLGDVLGTFFDEISDGFWRWPRSNASSGLTFDPSGSETRLQSQTPQLFLRFLGPWGLQSLSHHWAWVYLIGFDCICAGVEVISDANAGCTSMAVGQVCV